jgi:hypothetical protein
LATIPNLGFIDHFSQIAEPTLTRSGAPVDRKSSIPNHLRYGCFFPNETPNLQQIRPSFSSPWKIPAIPDEMASSRLQDWKGKEVSHGLEKVGCLNLFRLDLDNVDFFFLFFVFKKTCFHFGFRLMFGLFFRFSHILDLRR